MSASGRKVVIDSHVANTASEAVSVIARGSVPSGDESNESTYKLQISTVANIAKAIAKDFLGSETKLGHIVQITHTSEGDEAIRLILFLPSLLATEISGTKLLQIIRKVKAELSKAGESRPIIVSFARTDDEPELAGD